MDFTEDDPDDPEPPRVLHMISNDQLDDMVVQIAKILRPHMDHGVSREDCNYIRGWIVHDIGRDWFEWAFQPDATHRDTRYRLP